MPKTEEQCKQLREDMRSRILKNASLYFARNGFGDTKIGDLAKHIGIGQGTIYLYFKSKEELFEDYYRDTCLIKKEDMISFMKANTSYSLKETLKDVCAKVHVFYGSREVRRIRQSAKKIGEKIPGSTFRCPYGFRHGDFSLNHASEYAAEIRNITN